MNSGTAYMTEVSVQRLNSAGELLYEEKFSVLDAFGTHGKVSEEVFSLFSTEQAQTRYTAFIQWLKQPFLSGKTVVEGTYIDTESTSCPLPSADWETLPSLKGNTSLKSNSKRSILETSFDKVGLSKKKGYGLEFFFGQEEQVFSGVDYSEVENGTLVYKSEIPRNDLVFDINQKGELIVIGEDADKYFLNDLGELCYKY
jgi:hypothetical protein